MADSMSFLVYVANIYLNRLFIGLGVKSQFYMQRKSIHRTFSFGIFMIFTFLAR